MIKKIARHIKWRINFWRKIALPQIYFTKKLPSKVLSGPFAGMKYISSSTGSVVLPKLVGTYEHELNGIWKEASQYNYDVFVDVGAAEGYFAVGVSKYVFNNKVPVVAFELTAKGQRQVAELARINQVGTIEIKGICTKPALKQVLENRHCLVLMDVEGAELELLDPTCINFINCDILVEVHPTTYDGLEALLINRFKETHQIEILEPQAKHLPDNVTFPSIVKQNSNYMMNEFRGRQSWLWMKSKKG